MNKYFPSNNVRIYKSLLSFVKKILVQYCVQSVRIWSFSGLYFPTFGLNTERYRVFLRIQSKCGKIRTRKTPHTETFHAVFYLRL